VVVCRLRALIEILLFFKPRSGAGLNFMASQKGMGILRGTPVFKI